MSFLSHHIGLLASQTDDRQIHRNMTAVSIGKYCQFMKLFIHEILGEYNQLYITPRISGDHPHAPPKFSGYASRPTG